MAGSLFVTKKLLRSSTVRASERDEVGIPFTRLVRCHRQYGAAAKTDGVFTRVQRIEQEVLVAGSHACSMRASLQKQLEALKG